MNTRILILMFSLAAVLISASCRPQAAKELTIANAWAPATPPTATVGAAYLEIVAANADTLLGGSTPAAAKVEMHTNSEQGGMMRMRQLPSVDLRPGQSFSFQPGGAHLMLIGLKAPLLPESHLALTLRFKNAGDLVVDVPVAAPGTTPGQH
jgi:periplasmic copper chaperone A